MQSVGGGFRRDARVAIGQGFLRQQGCGLDQTRLVVATALGERGCYHPHREDQNCQEQ
jgi:hypothetical protein